MCALFAITITNIYWKRAEPFYFSLLVSTCCVLWKFQQKYQASYSVDSFEAIAVCQLLTKE